MIRFPPRRILVPMDASPESAVAWQQARILSRLFSCEAEVLHVRLWQPVGELGGADFLLSAQAEEEAMRWIRTRVGPRVAIHAADGDPSSGIVRFAKGESYDLVVMGTRGREGWSRALVGSVAESVVRRSAVPVMVVHRAAASFRSVLAPVNLSPHASAGLDAASRIALSLGAKLSLLSVLGAAEASPGGLEGVRELQRRLISELPSKVRLNCRPGSRIALGDPVDEILRESERHDVIVLVSHLKRPVRDRLFGTTAERVLRRAEAPVLVVPLEAAFAAAGHKREERHDEA